MATLIMVRSPAIENVFVSKVTRGIRHFKRCSKRGKITFTIQVPVHTFAFVTFSLFLRVFVST